MKHIDSEPEGQWEIPGPGGARIRKTLLMQSGEGHVLMTILGAYGGTQASMFLEADHAERAGQALISLAAEVRKRKEEANDRIQGNAV